MTKGVSDTYTIARGDRKEYTMSDIQNQEHLFQEKMSMK